MRAEDLILVGVDVVKPVGREADERDRAHLHELASQGKAAVAAQASAGD